MSKETLINAQISGSIVDTFNSQRAFMEIENLLRQDRNFSNALSEVSKVRDFIGTPENILGSQSTKHGEIAEYVQVCISNARAYLHGNQQVATLDGVGRTSAIDYIMDSVNVQSKFYNGLNNTLSNGVLGHLGKYPGFTNDGSYYHIPKDQYDIIVKILNGDSVVDLSDNTLRAIRNNIEKIENTTGTSFLNVVKPSISEYRSVQQGVIHNTLDVHESDLTAQNDVIKDEIRELHEASLSDGLKVTASAALVGAAVSFTGRLYRYHKNGKNVFKGELTVSDWKELGVDTAKGSVVGGISGAAIYGLTNYANLSAPFAAAIVGASKGVSSLYNDLNNGDITLEEFVNDSLLICSESAIVGMATFAGQTLIPIPVLGAVLGSIAGQTLLNLIGEKSGKTVSAIKSEMERFLADLEDKYRLVVKKITDEYKKLGDLTTVAFDLNLNVGLLDRSVDLARAYGVPEDKILKNRSDIDNYFLS